MTPQGATPTFATAQWLRERGVTRLVADSRQAQAGDAFVAWPGFVNDGRRYVSDALGQGATAALVEADGAEAFHFDAQRVLAVEGLKARAGAVASAFWHEPSAALDVIAVTGTNGKTSTAWWTAQALAATGQRCGLVGTLGLGEPGALEHTGLTTPDPVTFQAALRRFVDAGIAACAVEASSIGLFEHRLSGTRIAVAQFTNFTQDHLDFHGSMQAYWQAKAMLFSWPGLKAAVVNVDDPKGRELVSNLATRPGLQLITYSAKGVADAVLRAVRVQQRADGMSFVLAEGEVEQTVNTPLIGDFQVANLLAVVGALRALGTSLPKAVEALSSLTPVPGRLEVVPGIDLVEPMVVVDYAHSPDALEKALQTLRPLAKARGGALQVVFGCGGNRDAGKRPLMGAVAARQADRVWVTSDNPRNEDPLAIIKAIVAGITEGSRDAAATTTWHVESDRAVAIAQAIDSADGCDVVLIAGKGHETYQETAGRRVPFSDAQQAKAALQARAARVVSTSSGGAAA